MINICGLCNWPDTGVARDCLRMQATLLNLTVGSCGVQSGEVGGHQRLHGEHRVGPVGAVDEPLGSAPGHVIALALVFVKVVQHPVVEQTIE